MKRSEVQARAARIGLDAGCKVRLDERLAPYLSMRVGGTVPAFLCPRTIEDVARVVRGLRQAGVPLRLLGGGSNLLAADDGLDFAVVHLGSVAPVTEWTGTSVRAPAGLPLSTLLRESAQRGLSGLEWAAGLPGSIGGAVSGNAGAFGGEIGRAVREVTLLTEAGDLRRHAVSEGDFEYRRSFVAPGEVVLEVVLELAPGSATDVRAETDRVNRTRASSQPKGGHSSGCIFRNPPGAQAGRLIDECGLKGRRRGGAIVSPSHANFILNDGTATAADILGLIDEVREEVRRRTHVDLELEVKVWRPGAEETA